MMPSHPIGRLLLLALLACALPLPAPAAPPVLAIPRAARPPKLQDYLNGAPADAGTAVTDFRQRQPKDGAPISQPTTAYLSYDRANLYVVFICKDQPGKVRARLSKREDMFNDDIVGIFLDTYHDRRRAYMFFTNAYGVQMDGTTTEGQRDDFGFDTLWHSEGRMTREGYVALIVVPFKSLRFANSPRQTWGIALYRNIQRNNENTFWPHITDRVQGFLQQMATLEGLEDISPGRNLQFIPFGFAGRSRFLERPAGGQSSFRTANEARGGLDAKVVLRDSLTFDVALNPDFSQVESDEPQVTVNQRFEVFFPEKRPLFIENAGFFETPEQLFFSRRIVDPQSGVRMTGKIGRWALGVLAADDQAAGRSLPPGDPDYGRRAAIGVLRVQREIGQQSSVGLLATSRDFAASSNRVFSLDTRLRLNANWSLTGQAMRSLNREPDGGRRDGPAYHAQLSRNGRHFNYNGGYSDRSPDFDAQKLGFIPRVDVRQTEHFANYRWRPEGRRLIAYGPGAIVVGNWDRRGRVQDWAGVAGFFLEFTRQNFLEFFHEESFELFQDRGFRRNRSGAFFYTEYVKWLNVRGSYRWGTGVNYYPAEGLAPFLADSRNAELNVTVRPKPNVRVDQAYIYSRLGTRLGSQLAGSPAGAAIFNNHILRSKLNYQFTRALSLRAILDYSAVLPNLQLVKQEDLKRLTGDLLATYLINPGTAVHVGYSNTRENVLLDPGGGLRRFGGPDLSTGRQFFVKLSYLFRF